MKSFVAFLFSLLLSSAFAQEMNLIPTPGVPEFMQVETGNNLRGGRELQCRPAIQMTGLCWGLGQTVIINVQSCPTPYPEWVGIFQAGNMNFGAAFAWKYLCGSQGCATPVAAGAYSVMFGYDSAGSTSWPLQPIMMYQAWFHTAYGSFPSQQFQITPGFSCGPPGQFFPPSTGGGGGSRGPRLML